MAKWILIFFTLSFQILAETLPQAKVIFIKGKAEHFKDGLSPSDLSLNDTVNQKEFIKTYDQSFIKLEFTDHTTMTLSPNSLIRMEGISKQGPSLIQLLSGKIRGNVQKAKNQTHSFFIKTPSASLGVRGTEFEIIFNKENHITSALTFKGEVSLINSKETVHFDGPLSFRAFDDSYNEVLSDELENERTKIIKAGEFSGAYPGYSEPLIPVKISPWQFKILQKENFQTMASKSIEEDSISKKQSAPDKTPNNYLVPQPVANYTKENYPTQVLTRPGGYLDQKTGFYVAPPEDAPYDDKNQIYIIPQDFGKIDEESGDYIPPLGLILHPLKGFIFLEDQFNKLSEETKKLALKLNSSLKKGMARLKELTRLDSSLLPSFYYDSNVVTDFYNRTDTITNKPSYVLRFDGFLAHKTLDTKNWLIYPKGSVTTLYNYNQNEKIVNQQDSIDWTGGLEVNHRYLISHRPGRQIFELGYHITMKDRLGSDQYNYFTEDLFFIFGQEFKLHARHTTKLFGKFTYYETYLNKLGKIWSGHLKHSMDLGRRHDLILGTNVSRERPQNLRTIFIWEGFISHIWKNIWDHFTFTSTLRLKYTDLHLIIPERGEEKLISPEFRLTKILDDYLNISAFYHYEKNLSV